jgi:hypothetical protein
MSVLSTGENSDTGCRELIRVETALACGKTVSENSLRVRVSRRIRAAGFPGASRGTHRFSGHAASRGAGHSREVEARLACMVRVFVRGAASKL